ncbi:MAG: glycosyltransferase family 39 protein [Chthoniobacterales bacterium]|nr:glycosyltransferase family 39 protein [Chthoniobacterales bacterium]
MPGSANAIQRLIHGLEMGGAAVWVRRALTALAILALALFYLVHEFRGLASSQGMDQAQIGRELLHGHGWATKFARPLAIGQAQRHGKNPAAKVWVDTYNAPLPPLVDAIALLTVKARLKMTPSDVIYAGDRAIAAMSILLFLAAVTVLFFTARRLFDQRLALLSCGLVLVCDTLWQYTLSGLPQMLLLFLFNLTIYLLVRAIEAQSEGRSVGLWLAAAGVGFGLLALSNALTIWIFLPALAFCGFYFRPRIWAALLVLLPFVLLYTPWLIRNYLVSGNPAGLAFYALFDKIGMSEAAHMRHTAVNFSGMSLRFWSDKISGNIVDQLGGILRYLGGSVVALFFFATLLHPFRRVETAAMRWLVLVMWCGALAGMAVYGIPEEQGMAANQLHLLFIPVMTAFGLAFLLVQWQRFGIEYRVARIGFLTLLFLICGIPILVTAFFSSSRQSIRWPPYLPPYIAVIGGWMQPNEITATDMPWAVAWYADRRALWLPDTVQSYVEDSDYNVLGSPINGLYLTPISGSQNSLHDILKGDYRDWASVILRSVDLQKFPLKWATLVLGLDNECVFFSDHDRQKTPAQP